MTRRNGHPTAERSHWQLIRNPNYPEGFDPHALGEAQCHDGSPFLTVQCSCGSYIHFHETLIRKIGPESTIASYCPDCNLILQFPPGVLLDAFRTMRERGWLD